MPKTVTEHLRAHLLRELSREAPPPVSLDEMQETEWSPDFEGKMRRRLIVGGYRYGRLGDLDRPAYDTIGSIKKRADRYLTDGNQEHLVDIANLALVEFVRGCCHPHPTFAPVDDGEHAERLEG